VAALYLFGSHPRDEARPNSDVGVFVDVAPEATFGLRPYMGTFETLKQAVGEDVDYGTRKGLHSLLRSDINREAIRIF
jgi:predicted nucleotidyltransferase